MFPLHATDADTEEMNNFLAGHRILSIDRQLVPDGTNPVWAICVNYDDGGSMRPPPFSKRGKPGPGDVRAKIDYRDVLTDPEFAVFSRLRALRKVTADAEGIPAYAVFTNDQLAEMVQRRTTSATALHEIEGVGDSRVEKYGTAFLAILTDAALPAQEVPPLADAA
jgi:superfamily II DNA helicase RecQ